jgi:hypothetical protein
MVMDPMQGHLRFSPKEVEAVRVVSQAESQRAMSIGTTTAGGFAVPFGRDKPHRESENEVRCYGVLLADGWCGGGRKASAKPSGSALSERPCRRDR